MNKLVSIFKSIRLRQVLTVFLAGVLLMITTACAGNAQAKVPQGNTPGNAGSNPVGQNQPYEGGMNNFSDTAPGQAAKGTAAKTKALIDRAESDINTKGIDSVDQYVDNYRSGAPLGERTKKLTDNVKEGAKNAADDVKGLGDRVSDSASQVGDSATRGAKNAAENIKDNTKDAAKRTSFGIKDTVKNAAQATENAAKSANQKVQKDL